MIYLSCLIYSYYETKRWFGSNILSWAGGDGTLTGESKLELVVRNTSTWHRCQTRAVQLRADQVTDEAAQLLSCPRPLDLRCLICHASAGGASIAVGLTWDRASVRTKASETRVCRVDPAPISTHLIRCFAARVACNVWPRRGKSKR